MTFPNNSKLNQIIIKNIDTLSYSFMSNMEAIFNGHNRKILNA